MSRYFHLQGLLALTTLVLLAVAVGQQELPAYPVTLDGKPVIEIRWSHQAVPAAERARLVSQRLQAAANDYRLQPKVGIVSFESSMLNLSIGDDHIISVFPGDARAAGIDEKLLADQWARSFEKAITDYREQRSWKRRIQSAIFAFATLLAIIFGLVFVRRLTQNLAAAAVRRFESRIRSDGRQTIVVLARSRAVPVIVTAFSSLRFLLSALVLLIGFQTLLLYFPRTKATAARFLDSLSTTITGFAQAAWAHAPEVAFLILIAVITRYILRISSYIFRGLGEGSLTVEGFRPAWAQTTHRIVSFAVIILALLIAYPYIPGSNSPAFKGISIFLGLLVSLGSTGLMANIATGVMLTYMEAFHVGDLILIENRLARVERMSLLTTQLRTRSNEVLTLPNSVILSKEVANLSLADHRGIAVRCTVGIGYDVAWRQIEELLRMAAAKTPGVSATHSPYVLTLSLNQFDITYELTAHLEPDAPYIETRSILQRNVLDAFNEFGVQIMTPSYEGDPERQKVVPKSQWFPAPASTQPGLVDGDRSPRKVG